MFEFVINAEGVRARVKQAPWGLLRLVSPPVTLLAGRALLRMSEHQLDRLGIEPESQQEVLQDLLLLRVQEELENLNDIFSGKAH